MKQDNDSSVSSKSIRRQQRKKDKETRQLRRNPKPVEPRSKAQEDYIQSLYENELTFSIGPAGVGKTYIPSRIFGKMLFEGELSKLYLSRPPVAKNKHRMGFLPGTEEEKTAPWILPIYEGLKDSMSVCVFDRLRREKKIEIVPYEFIQGRTFQDSAWIVDGAENLDLDDFYITLTRQGTNLKAAICGDVKQARIGNSGLQTVVNMATHHCMQGVGIIEFSEKDVVRSRQARQWVKAFNRMPLPYVTNCDNATSVLKQDFPAFLQRGS